MPSHGVSNNEIFSLIRESKHVVVLLLFSGLALGVSAAIQNPSGGVFANVGIGIFAACIPLLAWIDQRTFRLPDFLNAPLAAVVAALFVFDYLSGTLSNRELLSGLGTGVGVGVLFLIIAIMMSGGLGMGDIKFVVIAGFILGTKSVVVAIFALLIVPPMVALVALIPVLVKFIVVKDDKNTLRDLGRYKFAYGPYLGVGALVGLFVPATAAFLTIL